MPVKILIARILKLDLTSIKWICDLKWYWFNEYIYFVGHVFHNLLLISPFFDESLVCRIGMVSYNTVLKKNLNNFAKHSWNQFWIVNTVFLSAWFSFTNYYNATFYKSNFLTKKKVLNPPIFVGSKFLSKVKQSIFSLFHLVCYPYMYEQF